ncbi:collectin-12 [Biomphalaria pfeifferi]|uniref:Collectin-12 n=1 Tax=Biomphalaria pfeifferi TaxID=112525 RepID=A0AAD8F980_BIOPF|nr:collectin-12 [Biomphalaria pfeifferi]
MENFIKIVVCNYIVIIISLIIQVSVSQQTEADLLKRCPPNLHKTYLRAAEWEICYEFHLEERTWPQANNVCQRNGGHLVTIREERIQSFLFRALVVFRWQRNGVWIGATDKEKEMDWKWITGQRVRDGYNNWARGQPSCGFFCMEDCALMKWKESGKWVDYHCTLLEEYSFICEYTMLPKPTTTTTTTSTTTTLPSTTTETTSTDTATVTETSTLATEVSSALSANMKGEYRIHVEDMDNSSSVFLSFNGAHSHQLEENSVNDNKGLLIALIISVLAGIVICLAIIVLIKRRQKKKQTEADDGISYANPYYGEAKQPLTAEASGITNTAIAKEEEVKSFVVEEQSDDEPAITLPRRVMNIYDKPPTRSVPLQNKSRPEKSEEADASLAENYYDEVRSAAGKSLPSYDVPRCLKETEDAACLENQYYNYTEENIYESLESLQRK